MPRFLTLEFNFLCRRKTTPPKNTNELIAVSGSMTNTPIPMMIRSVRSARIVDATPSTPTTIEDTPALIEY